MMDKIKVVGKSEPVTIYELLGAPDQAGWRDLRIWTALVLLPYIIIYIVY